MWTHHMHKQRLFVLPNLNQNNVFNTYVEVAELAKKHCTKLFRKSNIQMVKNSLLLTFLGCQCNNTSDL